MLLLEVNGGRQDNKLVTKPLRPVGDTPARGARPASRVSLAS